MMTATTGLPPGAASRSPPPPHEVIIKQPLGVGRFEITRGQFAEFVKQTGYAATSRCFLFQSVAADGSGLFSWVDGAGWRNPGYAQTDLHPVVCASWQDAHAYIDWLKLKSGRQYRLLSESEWSYVTSAGTGEVLWWQRSGSASCAFANNADESFKQAFPTVSEVSKCRDGFVYTAPVGSFKANAFGLFDLIGNAWEWLEDCGGARFESSPADGSPDLSGNCSNRVRRSGSWFRTPENNSSALPASDRHGNAGFRVVRVVSSASEKAQ